MTGRVNLRRLTSLRWFAALSVFACHFGAVRHQASYLGIGGYVGVEFFFVLSGVVLAWSALPTDTAGRFWLRRYARIYPASVAAAVIAASLSVIFGLHGSAPQPSSGALVASLTLSQAWIPPGAGPYFGTNPVLWSLSCEVLFYALFPLLYASATRMSSRSIVVGVVAMLIAGGVATSFMIAYGQAGYATRCPLLRLPEFVLGVAIGVGLRRGWRPHVSTGFALALLTVGVLVADSVPRQLYLPLPGTVLLLLAMATRDLDGRSGWLTRGLPVYLGEVSFCFYLVHRVVLDYIGSGIAGGASALVIAFAAAAALHHGLELPMQRRILRGTPRAASPEPAVAVL